MSVNTAKCKAMNVGRTNTESAYTIEDDLGNRTGLAPISNERDLGIMISRDLKPHDQVCKAASMANKVLGMLKSTFSRDAGLWKRLYTTYVRPHLEYAVQAWNPYATKDVKTLEKVQRRATKVPHLLRHLTYEERLHNLNLTTLEVRRKRGDLIQQYKIESGTNKVNWANQYERGVPRRGMRGNIQTCQQRRNFLKNRVVKPGTNCLIRSVKPHPETSSRTSWKKFSTATIVHIRLIGNFVRAFILHCSLNN